MRQERTFGFFKVEGTLSNSTGETLDGNVAITRKANDNEGKILGYFRKIEGITVMFTVLVVRRVILWNI